MRIILFTQFYTPKNERRRAEVDECLHMNVRNPAIDEVHVLLEAPEDRARVPVSNKVKLFDHPPRLTYGEWLRRSGELAPGDISILVNADIYLDETVEQLRARAADWAGKGQFLALTRYNPKDIGFALNNMPHWTQDTWIVSRGEKPFPRGLIQEAGFELGYPGCDNKIAYVMHSYGYGVSNPCLQIRSVHLQADEKRSYDDRSDKLIGLHAFVHPAPKIGDLSALEFDLLTRATEDPLNFRVNHWINRRKDYVLRGETQNADRRMAPRRMVDERVLTSATFGATLGRTAAAPGAQAPTPPARAAAPALSTPAPTPPAAPNASGLAYVAATSLQGKPLAVRIEFTRQLRLCEDDDTLYWVDAAWTGVPTLRKQLLPRPLADMSPLELFVIGFAPPAFELLPTQVANQPRYPQDALFWQYPARTERDAWERVRELSAPDAPGTVRKVYLGLPWATFIDRKMWPESLFLTVAARLKRVRDYLSASGVELQIHTVCQHIFWNQYLDRFKRVGVTDLWISHKVLGEDEASGLRLHAWHLYPVNLRDGQRQQGLEVKPHEQRPVTACFSGAHMKHYLSDVRLRLKALAQEPGFEITLTDEWHFNKAIYNHQVHGKPSSASSTDQAAVLAYNRQLSNSVFSLCPVGAGPNTIRLWESLGAGAIPVLLSDSQELPDLELFAPGRQLRWEDALIRHPEGEVSSLAARLRDISAQERDRLQQNGRALYHLMQMASPLGQPAGLLPSVAVLDRFKPQQVQAHEGAKPVVDGQAPWGAMLLPLAAPSAAHWVQFDATERLLGFEVELRGVEPGNLELSFGLSHLFREIDHRLGPWKPPSPLSTLMLSPDGAGRWAIGVKVDLRLEPSARRSAEAAVVVRPLVAQDHFALACRRLDEAGVLAAASSASASRKDDLFDTLTIESGAVVERLQALVPAGPGHAAEESPAPLFPYSTPATHNLAGEPLGDGISLYVHLMNRNANVQKNLGNWLQQGVDELILLDWSSDPPVAAIPGLFDDPRVRVVRVEGQKRFVRTWAQNLATRMARHRRIFKCDSDVIFTGDFFAAHPLQRGEFWVGDWRQGRDHNERHLHGDTYYHIDDFNKVNGYDERITSYGQDDTNLKDRMALAGLVKRVLHYNQMAHQPHDNTGRTTNQKMVHPMVNTRYHRLVANEAGLWGPGSAGGCRVTVESISPQVVTCRVAPAEEFAARPDLLDRAIDTVAAWYAPPEKLQLMNRQARIALIWEKSVE